MFHSRGIIRDAHMTTIHAFIRFLIPAALSAVCVVLLAADSLGRQQSSPKSVSKISVEQFLRKYLHDPQFGEDKATQYSVAFVNLGGNPKDEVVVYISGPRWCGSGGCLLLVLEPNGSSYTVIGRTTIVRLPIRVLQNRTNGWRDIGVRVQGGGIQPGYEAALPFDGKKYPSNPSLPPARRLTEDAVGELIIPESGKADRPSAPD
jgi:hypothetical protein